MFRIINVNKEGKHKSLNETFQLIHFNTQENIERHPTFEIS